MRPISCDAVKAALDLGWSIEQLARVLERPRMTIWGIAKRHGYHQAPRRPGRPPGNWDRPPA